MPGRLEFQLNSAATTAGRLLRPGQGPLRVLLLGDFSQRPVGERPELAQRPTHRLDVDRLDKVLAQLAPRLHLLGETFPLQRLDDFHPDHLYGQLAALRTLRDTRARGPGAPGEGALDRLLGQPAGQTTPAAPSAGGATQTSLDSLLQQWVAPHVVPDTSAQLRSHQAVVDSASTAQMRALLHDPGFQALEAHWRGVQWLISQLALDDDNLQLHLLDLDRTELLRDIVGARGQVGQTALRQTLDTNLARQAGGGGWSTLVVCEHFGADDTEVGLLAALGTLASQLGAPLLASANHALQAPSAAGSPGWQALRRSEVAPWIGLVAPRLLLRLPYGKQQDPIESFEFEELPPGPPEHEHLLWGHPSLAVAALIGQSFMASGWNMQAGALRDITDLPAYTFEHDGERELQACAERYLSDTAAAELLARGLMPLLSHRHRNAALLMRLQSIADPAGTLAGPWSG
jgi:type VI secretion system protein ImpC